MKPVFLIATAVLLGIIVRATDVEACSSLSVRPEIWTFACDCCCDEDDLPDIVTVSGTILLNNRKAAPTLGNLVVELETKNGGGYAPVAVRVLNAAGDDVVESCKGLHADGPFAGELTLVDEDGNPIPFESVADLPEGVATLRYRATFAGEIPGLEPGGRVRVRTLTSLIGADAALTCDVDADNDGMVDEAVKTHDDRSTVRVPAAPIVLPCPD